jgi:hypothetical protein
MVRGLCCGAGKRLFVLGKGRREPTLVGEREDAVERADVLEVVDVALVVRWEGLALDWGGGWVGLVSAG